MKTAAQNIISQITDPEPGVRPHLGEQHSPKPGALPSNNRAVDTISVHAASPSSAASNQSTSVRITDLRTDRCPQTRVSLCRRTVKEYAEAMRRGKLFEPIEVYRVNGELWLVDGSHRVEAAKLCPFDTIDAIIFEGTRTDAIRASLAANQNHGLRRTNKDKRLVAELAVKEFRDLSSRQLAEMCGVSHELIAEVKSHLLITEDDVERKVLGRDGKRRKMPQPTPAKGDEPGASASPIAGRPHKTTETPSPEAKQTAPKPGPEETKAAHAGSDAAKEPAISRSFDMEAFMERLISTMKEGLCQCPPERIGELSFRISHLACTFGFPSSIMGDVPELVRNGRQAFEDTKEGRFSLAETNFKSTHPTG